MKFIQGVPELVSQTVKRLGNSKMLKKAPINITLFFKIQGDKIEKNNIEFL